MTSISLLRLYLLRACYLLLVGGLSIYILPELFGRAVSFTLEKGVVTAMLSSLCILSAFGIFAPLRMLPILIMEILWKLIWTLSVAVPRMIENKLDGIYLETVFECALVLPFLFIVPWKYVIATHSNSLERWWA